MLLLTLNLSSSSSTPQVKYWDGSVWTVATLKYYDSAIWNTGTLKYWDGASWVAV